MPNSLRAALATALFTFFAAFGAGLLGWLAAVAEWAATSGTADFPDLSVLGYLAVSAFVAAAAGLTNWVVRYAQERTGAGVTPTYSRARSVGAAAATVDWRWRLAQIIPMPFRSTYSPLDQPTSWSSGATTVVVTPREESRWWQWRNRIWRHRRRTIT